MIYLIRHGQASFGLDDYDRLSPLGIRQARILAEHLLAIGVCPNAVYSGTLVRQTATAQEVLAAYRAAGQELPPLELLEGLNEFDSDAVIAAVLPAMLQEDPSLELDLPKFHVSKSSFKRVFEGAMFRWVSGQGDLAGVESWTAFKARVFGSLQTIIHKHGRGQTIAVFTSGGPIAASLACLLGISSENAMWLNWQILNTSITRYMYRQDQVTLAGFNSIAHLELAADPTLLTYK